MHTIIDVRLDVRIDEDKSQTLATLAETITEQRLKSTILKEPIERQSEVVFKEILK